MGNTKRGEGPRKVDLGFKGAAINIRLANQPLGHFMHIYEHNAIAGNHAQGGAQQSWYAKFEE